MPSLEENSNNNNSLGQKLERKQSLCPFALGFLTSLVIGLPCVFIILEEITDHGTLCKHLSCDFGGEILRVSD